MISSLQDSSNLTTDRSFLQYIVLGLPTSVFLCLPANVQVIGGSPCINMITSFFRSHVLDYPAVIKSFLWLSHCLTNETALPFPTEITEQVLG